MSRRIIITLLGMLLLAAVIFVVVQFAAPDSETIPDTMVDTDTGGGVTFNVDGKNYLFDKCNLYEGSDGNWRFVEQLCEPGYYEKNYATENGKIYLRLGDGTRVEVRKQFAYDFESDSTVQDLLSTNIAKRGWTTMTLLSPRTPTTQDYISLRNCLRAGTCNFTDNRAEPTTQIAHLGKRSLKTVAVPPTKDMVTSKASVSTEFIHFVKGNDVWYSAWYYLEEGQANSIMDLETTWIKNDPGIRIWMNSDRSLEVELKGLARPKYKQVGKPVTMPLKKWTHVVAHFTLSETKNGTIEVWQDGLKIINARGQTLVFSDTIYNSLEVGISANPHGQRTTLYVDDVVMSNKPLNR